MQPGRGDFWGPKAWMRWGSENQKAAWRPTIVKISPVKLYYARAFYGAENHD